MSAAKQCAQCQQPATWFVSLVKNGQVTTMACCEHHATELGWTQAGAHGFLDEADATTPAGAIGAKGCPACGFTLRDWKRTGRFGCPECYDTFKVQILPALERLHTDTFHRGKFPRRLANPALIANRMRELQEQLDRQVQAERYEEAAQTRDEMSVLREAFGTQTEHAPQG